MKQELIELERSDLKAKPNSERSEKVLKQKVETNEITKTLEELVSIGGYQGTVLATIRRTLRTSKHAIRGRIKLARTKLDAESRGRLTSQLKSELQLRKM